MAAGAIAMGDGMLLKLNRVIFLWIGCISLLGGCSTLKNAEPWYRISLDEEFTRSDLRDDYRWPDYLAQEERLFAQLRRELAEDPRDNAYRFNIHSPLNSLNHQPNWNRSFVLKPQHLRGAILMIHGLSDSPYSVRSLGLHFQQQGFYVIGLRLPGHGTLPTGLLTTDWRDWAAAVELAAKELHQHLGENQPLFLLGYSAGAALAVNYALEAQHNTQLPKAQKLVLISPMFGISFFASFTKNLDLISRLPLMSAYRWTDQSPEYNPFKYNSFTLNAGWQAHSLVKQVNHRLQQEKKRDNLRGFPPVLGFQSLMDSTVHTQAVKDNFFDLLPANHSELVIFDINRQQSLAPLMRPTTNTQLSKLFNKVPANYQLVKIANSNPTVDQVSEWRYQPGADTPTEKPLGLAFPRGVYSLTHIALPFPPDDPTYGLQPRTDEFYGISLGNLDFRGERNTLIIAQDANQRLNANPFYSYMQQRMDEWLGNESIE
ncbi:alpha/beta hydrolase [Cellvibrio japonicus]|nr:alpha/beta fold hydrolase [Cellvibrio japonicus]QEI13797.1 lysophospholipase [Cellvibrio japonicus]QEI17371.1 lysophospholipase [Cellvibrio japonicus]QEI20947.1 lysophospholipase [Cellvibrio japonicus]